MWYYYIHCAVAVMQLGHQLTYSNIDVLHIYFYNSHFCQNLVWLYYELIRQCELMACSLLSSWNIYHSCLVCWMPVRLLFFSFSKNLLLCMQQLVAFLCCYQLASLIPGRGRNFFVLAVSRSGPTHLGVWQVLWLFPMGHKALMLISKAKAILSLLFPFSQWHVSYYCCCLCIHKLSLFKFPRWYWNGCTCNFFLWNQLTARILLRYSNVTEILPL